MTVLQSISGVKIVDNSATHIYINSYRKLHYKTNTAKNLTKVSYNVVF